MRKAIGRRHYRGRAALAGVAAMVLAAACDANVILLQPEQAVTGDAITLEVVVTDPALAERLGWAPGTGVPDAMVQSAVTSGSRFSPSSRTKTVCWSFRICRRLDTGSGSRSASMRQPQAHRLSLPAAGSCG